MTIDGDDLILAGKAELVLTAEAEEDPAVTGAPNGTVDCAIQIREASGSPAPASNKTVIAQGRVFKTLAPVLVPGGPTLATEWKYPP